MYLLIKRSTITLQTLPTFSHFTKRSIEENLFQLVLPIPLSKNRINKKKKRKYTSNYASTTKQPPNTAVHIPIAFQIPFQTNWHRHLRFSSSPQIIHLRKKKFPIDVHPIHRLNPNLKVAYEDSGYVWKFPRKISASPKAVETRFEGTQSRADAVKFASRIHYANPRPPPPPGHLLHSIENEGRKGFRASNSFVSPDVETSSSSSPLVSMSGIDFHLVLFWRGWYARFDGGATSQPGFRFEIIDANCGRYGIKRTVGND